MSDQLVICGNAEHVGGGRRPHHETPECEYPHYFGPTAPYASAEFVGRWVPEAAS